jgi:hypothetical protein
MGVEDKFIDFTQRHTIIVMIVFVLACISILIHLLDSVGALVSMGSFASLSANAVQQVVVPKK